MTVTINKVVQLASQVYAVYFSSDLADPVFRVYRDGQLVQNSSQTSCIFQISQGESPVIHIYDDDTSPGVGYPSRIKLHWKGDTDAAQYKIERYVGGEWTLVDTVFETGRTTYSWFSPALADCSEHKFRVVPVGTNGNTGTEKELTVFMVRHPSPPDVNFTYDEETRILTMTEN